MAFKSIRIILVSFILSVSFNTYAIIIDFEGASGSVFNLGEFLDVGDYRFTLTFDGGSSSNGFEVITGQNNIVEPGTTKLFGANHVEITMGRIDGAAFNLNSVDIGGSFVDSPNRWADHVDVIGGGSTSTAFLAGQPATYQNITPNFLGVTSVLFSPIGNIGGGANDFEFTIDNISVSSVPEPSIILLLGSGLALLGFARRKA